ncbi:MAG TPA: CoA-binding protein [Thermosulfidibacter takaii]|uniref:CoA-binding protein n=1 Tax=Thermosulfidibacter takaii TaxID=412593 RepID=A0A7C0Y5V9_9BACT|nr:CoA-binding protein [Thermosulfidibacter takaii]
MVPEHLMEIVKKARTIAVVGASPREGRPSLRIYRFLKKRGYRVFPVNPNYPSVDGDPTYPSLLAIEEDVDVVDVFRRKDKVLEGAVRKRVKLIWMQEGVVNPQAARLAEEAGIPVVMDRCIY